MPRIRVVLRQGPEYARAHGLGPAKSLRDLCRISRLPMDLAGKLIGGGSHRHLSRVLPARTGAEARLSAPMVEVGPARVLRIGYGHGWSGNRGVQRRPAA